jgi:hypothetical protein
VSLDSGGWKRDAVQEDDTDFYSGGGNIAAVFAAGSSLQNGVAAAAVTSSSYSEALTPVTNKVSFIISLNGHHSRVFISGSGRFKDRDLNVFLNSDLGPGLTESCLDLNPDPALKL